MENHQLGSLVEQTGSWFISDSDAFDDDAFNTNFGSDESDYPFIPEGDYGAIGYAGAPPSPVPATPGMPGAYLHPTAAAGYGQYPDPGMWSMGSMTPASTPMYPAPTPQGITTQFQFGQPSPRMTGTWSCLDNQFAIAQAPLAPTSPLSPPPTLPSPSPTDDRTSQRSRAQQRMQIRRSKGPRQPRRRKTPPPRVSCSHCGKELADERSLVRHRYEKHGISCAPATDDGTGHSAAPLQKFKCRCGYECPRKANYRRHLKTCDPRKHVDDKYFRCECGVGQELLVDHDIHITDCGKKKVGRPAKLEHSETASSHSSSLLSRQVSQQSYRTM